MARKKRSVTSRAETTPIRLTQGEAVASQPEQLPLEVGASEIDQLVQTGAAPDVATFRSVQPMFTDESEQNVNDIIDIVGRVVDAIAQANDKIKSDILATLAVARGQTAIRENRVRQDISDSMVGARQAVDNAKGKVEDDILNDVVKAVGPVAPIADRLIGKGQAGQPLADEVVGAPGNDGPQEGVDWQPNEWGGRTYTSFQNVPKIDPNIRQAIVQNYGQPNECLVFKWDQNVAPFGIRWRVDIAHPSPLWNQQPPINVPAGYELFYNPAILNYQIVFTRTNRECGAPEPPPQPEPKPDIPKLTPPEPTPQGKPQPEGRQPEATPGSCVRLCPPEETEKECPKWSIYKAKAGGCYIVPAGQSPRNQEDTLLQTGEPNQSWVEILSKCREADPRDEIQGGAGSDMLPTAAKIIACFTDQPLESRYASFAELFKSWGLDGDSVRNAFPTWSLANLNPIQANISAFMQLVVAPALDLLTGKLTQAQSGFACPSAEAVAVGVQNFLIRWLNTLGRGSFGPTQNLSDYKVNELCQSILPSSADAISGWLSGEFSTEQRDCLLRANGALLPWFTSLAYGARQKLTPVEQVRLYKIGAIDREEFQKRIRSLGFVADLDAREIERLYEQIPPPQDIIRFMVRDADDKGVVEAFNLDSLFDEKFGRQLKQWAEWQGMPEEYMRYLWRAHWQIPSPTQLYEFWRRLRHNPQFGGPEKLLKDIKAALVQQDIPPYWQDQFIATATLPPTRTDIRRAYEIGSINRDRVWLAFTEQGSSDEQATLLTEFTVKQKSLKFARHPLVAKMASGQVGLEEFRTQLAFEGADEAQIEYAFNRAKIVARQNSRRACTKAATRRYMLGETDFADLITQYRQLGVPEDIASMLATEASCLRSARGKRAPLMTLSKWYRAGVIDRNQLASRMTALQFDWGEIESTIRYLDQEIETAKQREQRTAEARRVAEERRRIADAQRQAKKAEQAVKEAQKAIAKQLKEQEAKTKEQSDAEAKHAKEAQRNLDVANKAQQKIEDAILDLGGTLSKALAMPLGDGFRLAKAGLSIVRRIANDDTLTLANIGKSVAGLGEFTNPAEFLNRWESAVNEGIQVPRETDTVP